MRSAVLLVALSATAAELTIRVTDETGKPCWSRLEVRGADGTMHQSAGALTDNREVWRKASAYPFSFVVNGEAKLALAPGVYRIAAEHGLEYPRLERTVTLPAAGLTVPLAMTPWIRMHQRGWYSADFHVHRPMEEAPSLARAEDVNLSVVFTMWNRRNLWAGKSLPADPVQQVTPRHLLTLMNAEDERAGGAWMFHQIREPLGLENAVAAGQATTASWFPQGLDYIRRVREWRKGEALLPWFDAEKTIWWEVPVTMALEAPDSLGLLNNHFHQYGMLDNEAWGRPRDPALGFSDYVLSLYYRYLNLGFRLPPSAGSASGVLPNPVGYNRIYAHVTGELTVEKWYASFREHRSFVTNGPMLFWNPKLDGGTLRVNLEAMAREPIDRIEIVANGKVIRRVAARAGARTIRAVLALDVSGHSWVAARCFLKTKETVRLAHTAPLYLEGKWDASADARFFLQWIDELIAKTAQEPQAEKLHATYRKAREFYAAKAGMTAQEHKARGVELASRNEYVEAEPHFQAACRMQPDLPDACYYQARALHLMDRFDPAVALLRKIAPDDPVPGRVAWALAQSLEASGDEGAEVEYRRALEAGYRHGKADGDTRVLYGVYLYRQGRVEEARTMLRQAAEARPDSSRAQAELGRVMLQLGKPEEAVALLNRALQLDRGNHAAELMLAKASARLSR